MAKIIAFGKTYEPLDIELGGDTVHAQIDLRDSSINKNWDALRKSRGKMDALKDGLAKLESSDSPEADALARDMAEIMRPAICCAIGEDAYRDILVACGIDGKPVPAEEANMVMALVFSEIEVAIIDRLTTFKNNKAAHYLKELTDAQAEPHKA